MKLFLILSITLLSFFVQQEKPKMKGTYKVVFDKGQQSFQITFNDSIYIKKMPDAIQYKSKIKYEKFIITLRNNSDEDPIEIDNREINKDTILFSTKSRRDLSLTINRGKMIKIK